MNYYIKKILGLVLTVFLVSLITFAVFQILPGDPATIILGVDADPLQLEALREELNLDASYIERYLGWLAGLFKGDLGVSYRYGQPVSDLISNGLEVTTVLAAISFALTVAMGLLVGLFISKYRDSALVKPLISISQIGISVPSFCMAILLISIFSVQLRLLPSIGYVPWAQDPVACTKSLILPALSIALGSAAVLTRYVFVSVGKEQGKDYVKTAKSKGISDNRILNIHVLRNSLIPVITILGMITTDVLGGSIIIETVFSLPGIGKLISTSISTRDLPLIQGLVFYLAVIVVTVNFIVDIMYSIVDPRIRVK